jgi:hypothetical protein
MSAMKFLTTLAGLWFTGLTSLVNAQQCNFIIEKSMLRTDIETTKPRLKLLSDSFEPEFRRSNFGDILLGQHFALEGDSVVVGLWTLKRAIPPEHSNVFEYWTLQFPSLREGQVFEVTTGKNNGVFSSGASSWVQHGSEYWSSLITGRFSVVQVFDAGVIAEIDIATSAIFAANVDRSEKMYKLKGRYFLPKVSRASLKILQLDCVGQL